MKRFRDLLLGNIQWKCLALVLAVFLWLICINVVNPIMNRGYSNTLTIRNLDVVEANGYVLLNKEELESQIIAMNVRAESDSFSNLANADFTPYIDVSPIDYLRDNSIGRDQPVIIHIERRGAAAELRFSPIAVEPSPFVAYIRLDKITEVTKPITVTVTGTPKEGYVALRGVSEPDSLKITGPSTIINGISSVVAEANIEGEGEYAVRTVNIRVFDINKRDITAQLNMETHTVDVTVPVHMYGRVPVRCGVTGVPAQGYEYVSVSQNVGFVDVVGQESDIKDATYITLPDIDITGLTSTSSFTVDIRPLFADSPLSIAYSDDYEVIVTVVIEPHAREVFNLRISEPGAVLVGLEHGLVVPPPIRIDVPIAGLPEAVREFDPETDVTVVLDVTGLGPGVHDIIADVTLNREGVYLTSNEVLTEIRIEETVADTEQQNDME